MTPLRKREQIQAELTGLQSLAEITPRDDPFAPSLLDQKIESLRGSLKSIESQRFAPETEIMFGGGPVFGSEGIDAKFAAKILDSFQDMVTNEFAATNGLLRRTGRRKGESDARLLLTSLPRGSVGLQLAQPFVEDFLVAEKVAKAMEEVTALVEAAAASDESFEEALANFHPRVFKPLGRFFDAMVNADAECRMLTGMRSVTLQKDRILGGSQRVSATVMNESTVKETGRFGGVLIASRKFEFVPDRGGLIAGWLAETVSEEDAEKMAALTGSQSVAEIQVTSIQTQTGKERPSYELIKLEPWK